MPGTEFPLLATSKYQYLERIRVCNFPLGFCVFRIGARIYGEDETIDDINFLRKQFNFNFKPTMYLELNRIEPLSRDFFPFFFFFLLFSFPPPPPLRERAQSHRRGTILDVGRDLRIDFHPADFR